MFWKNKLMLATTLGLGLGSTAVVMVLPLLVQKYRIQPFPSPDQIAKVSARPDLGRVEDGHDVMEKRSKDLSGVAAVDCGTVGIQESPQLTTKYALQAYSQGNPIG